MIDLLAIRVCFCEEWWLRWSVSARALACVKMAIKDWVFSVQYFSVKVFLGTILYVHVRYL